MKGFYTASEAKNELGLEGTSFWRFIGKEFDAKRVTPQKYGARTYRFPRVQIDAIKERCRIETREDLKRLADGRRS